MICQRCAKEQPDIHTCTPSDYVRKIEQQRDELLSAAENLIRVKGRHHSEQAYKQLEAVVAKVKP